MEEVNEKKREIVNEIRKQLEAFSEEAMDERQKAIEERLFDFANFLEARIALFYITRGEEVSTQNIIKKTLESGKKVALPLVDRENSKTTLFRIDNLKTDLIMNENHELQPDQERCKALAAEDIDIAVIPGLAFDEKGGRIGIEDNFYDKFVAKLPVTTRKIALAYEEMVVPLVPADSRNKHIDIIITDKRTIYKI